MYKKIITELKTIAEPEFADWLKPFLNIKENSKEKLLGIRIPILRKLAKKYKEIEYKNLLELLHSNFHEARELAVFIMLLKTKKQPREMFEIYLNNLDYINNWDLIDYSAPHIVAPLASKKCLKKLANSDYLWANRVAMVSTIYFIKQGNFDLALEFAKKFMKHPHHLMHKVSGWMLREIGKKDKKVLIDFLEKYEKDMPAIMRSYAKEKLK